MNSHRFSWNSIDQVFAFGDSYSFVQGTAGLANFSFIGDAFNLSFTPETLLTNQIIPKNTSSEGSNWLEFLTGCFEGEPLQCQPRQLWDFSFAGADIDKSLLPLHHNFTVPLVDQVTQWVQYASEVIPPTSDDARLTAWWIGINDTGDVLGMNITDFDAFWEAEMTSYFDAVENAYTHGLRGAHLFLNVPPEDRAPGHLNTTNAAPEKQRVTEFNAALNTHLATFASGHPDLAVFAFDAHAWFTTVLDNPSTYGFGNVTGYCECTNTSYFWYNSGHPTERVHRLLADAISAQLMDVSE
ncbi:hypothetical protein OF83DRAFT_1049465 [Amylostereum chailletii]|nr:hypothetical protein OF83DRAFT_1049465 [Amylostereum chailletii]